MKEGFIHLGEKVFPTLLAISQEEQAKGLMYAAWPPPVMSFIYIKPQINKFWMKNTPSPLDIVFCYNNKITQIHKGDPYSTSQIGDDSLSDLIIELPFGTISKSGIKLLSRAGLVHPSVEDLIHVLGNSYF
jgi:uncharacterized protein